ncbi:PTS sugar transporter subunit IIA [Micropruina sp.]|uniref:PTS sugar transporter subunit IIA n=1 Tax=Micropruina sp. TaxID=2737536 RepID=UPI0039E44BCE
MITIGGQSLIFEPGQVIIAIDAATSMEAIRPLSQRLIEAELVAPDFLTHIMAREATFPTGLPTEPVGVAIPHTDPEHVHASAMAVGVLSRPVDFGVMGAGDDEVTPVSVIFLLAIAPGTGHMNVLGSLIRLIQDAEFLGGLSNSSAPSIHAAIVDEFSKNSQNK